MADAMSQHHHHPESQSTGRTAAAAPANAPQDALPEIQEPFIPRCICKPSVYVLPPPSTSSQGGAEEPPWTKIDLVREEHAEQAYMRIPSRPKIPLNHHAPGWGCVYFGVVLKKVAENIFQAPNPPQNEDEQSDCLVAIKRLNKRVVNHYLAQGGHENPYIEILRMQTIGDNIHVLRCVEALQDETFLYIIMPYCPRQSLKEVIPWNLSGERVQGGFPEHQARVMFQQIVENLCHLRQHGICHRDLSPDNCMIYRERLVFTDLAMSFRVPGGNTTQPVLVNPRGVYGKLAFLPPEAVMRFPFDGFGLDLWSGAVTLFNLLTGQILYEAPIPSDVLFRYFVMAQGLSRTPVNERTIEVLTEQEENVQSRLRLMAQAAMSLSPEVLELLEHVLFLNPSQRWSLAHVQNSSWLSRNIMNDNDLEALDELDFDIDFDI